MLKLPIRLTVMVLLNKRTVRAIDEQEDSGRMVDGSLYGQPNVNSLQPARTVRFYAKYEF